MSQEEASSMRGVRMKVATSMKRGADIGSTVPVCLLLKESPQRWSRSDEFASFTPLAKPNRTLETSITLGGLTIFPQDPKLTSPTTCCYAHVLVHRHENEAAHQEEGYDHPNTVALTSEESRHLPV